MHRIFCNCPCVHCRYTFYLDYLAAEYEDRSQNALLHLREQSEYVRVLGSYPTGSVLVGPVLDAVRALDAAGATGVTRAAIGAMQREMVNCYA